MTFQFRQTLFMFSAETLQAMLADADKMIAENEIAITATEVRYLVSRELNRRTAA